MGEDIQIKSTINDREKGGQKSNPDRNASRATRDALPTTRDVTSPK